MKTVIQHRLYLIGALVLLSLLVLQGLLIVDGARTPAGAVIEVGTIFSLVAVAFLIRWCLSRRRWKSAAAGVLLLVGLDFGTSWGLHLRDAPVLWPTETLLVSYAIAAILVWVFWWGGSKGGPSGVPPISWTDERL